MLTKKHLAASVEDRKIAARESAEWFMGISRHGIVAADRIAQDHRTRSTFRRGASQFAGSVFIGLGVSLFVHSQLGVPAYDVMLTALRDQLGITLGQAGFLFTSLLFLVAALLGRRPRISGLVYMLSNGVAVDVWMHLIRDPDHLAVRYLFVFIGTLSIATGVALVVHAGLTGGAVELLMRAAEDRGFDAYRARQAIELSIVVAGVLLGGDVGIATAIFVLAMSPALKAGRQALADHQAGRHARLSVHSLTAPTGSDLNS